MNPTLFKAHVGLLAMETRWLMRLRWWAGALIIVLGTIDWTLGDGGNSSRGVVLIGLVVLAYNATLFSAARVWPQVETEPAKLLNFASLQVGLDFACLIALTLRTGGVLSPVMFAFLPHMLFASLVQPAMRTLATAACVVVALAAGLWLTDQWPVGTRQQVTVLGWIGTIILTVYLTNRVTSALYRREESRIRQIERNEEIWGRLVAQQASLMQAEKMAVMGQMVAGIAHEITNPLANMDSVLQLMQRNPTVARPASVTTLRQQIERILQIMRQFTTFAHPGQGAATSATLSEVVQSSLEMMTFNRAMKRIEVITNLDPEEYALRLDPHAMHQVVTNILSNAVDALESVRDARITIQTNFAGGVATLEIADNGPGISAEHMPRIFDAFFTTKPVGKGTGLGLSICARLVREQGGRIQVRSEPRQGTVFVITLPAPAPQVVRVGRPKLADIQTTAPGVPA